MAPSFIFSHGAIYVAVSGGRNGGDDEEIGVEDVGVKMKHFSLFPFSFPFKQALCRGMVAGLGGNGAYVHVRYLPT